MLRRLEHQPLNWSQLSDKSMRKNNGLEHRAIKWSHLTDELMYKTNGRKRRSMSIISRISLMIGLMILQLIVLSACAPQSYQSSYFNAQSDEPYTLASGDRLRIIVFGQDAISNTYAVDGSGHISMPLIGLVSANGLTTHQLEEAISGKLRAGYIREPKVSVEVEAYRPFFVLGEVTSSGQYPYINGMTIQTAVAVAGGFTPRAQQNAATLTRIIDGKPTSGNVPITQSVRPGDIVTIRERFF